MDSNNQGRDVFGEPSDWSQFKTGSILMLQAKDFMTYTLITIYPGPALNVLIGPNGTGKSSLVCAICIALAGKPTLLGRADDLKDFVRRGCQKSSVTIELKAEPRNYVVRREITLVEGATARSQFYVNDLMKSSKQVEELMKSLNIQLDNLCQFLPQDKVVKFAKLNPMELLHETEKALGDATLRNQHIQLIEMRNNFKRDDQIRDSNEANLHRFTQLQEQQQRDYQRFQQRQTLLDEAVSLQKQALWAEAEEQSRIRDAAAENKNQAEVKLHKEQQRAAGDDRPIRALKQQKQVVDAEAAQHARASKALENRFQDSQSESQKLWTEYTRKLLPEYAGLQAESDKRKAKIVQAQQALQRAVQELQQHPPVSEEITHQINELDGLFQQARQQVLELEQKKEELTQNKHAIITDSMAVKERIQKMEDVKLNRLQVLEREMNYRGIRQAYQWVQQQKQQGAFQDQVFGPMALEVQVENPLYAQYLENEIGANKWSQFVALNRKDETLMTEHFRNKGWGIPTAAFTNNFDAPIQHAHGPASNYAALGITHTLDEVFDAHPVIKHMLGVGSAYVTDKQVNIDRIKQSGIRKIYTRNLRVDVRVSRYNSAAISTAEKELKRCQLFREASSNEELQALHRELDRLQEEELLQQQQLDQVQQQVLQATDGMQSLQEQRDQLAHTRNALLAGKRKLLQAVQVAESFKNRAEREPEPLDKRPVLMQQIHMVQKKMQDMGVKGLKIGEELIGAQHKYGALHLRSMMLQMQVDAATAEHQQRRVRLQQLQDAFKQREREYNEACRVLRNMEDEAKQEDPQGAAKTQWQQVSQRARMAGEPAPSVEAMLRDADSKNAEAAQIHISNPGVAAEYRKRQEEIDALKQTLARQKKELSAVGNRMEEIKNAWLPKLRELVQTVNTSFSTNFAEIGCAGEVILVEDQDYDKFRVEIRVKFREEEQLQVLTAHRQSGGERSVSTILYLIALQGVTQTPFRVVDEINQGMDPVNERKVFAQLVDAASKDQTPQCFLLTPKVLSGLEYGKRASVLCIFNGTQMDPAISQNKSLVNMFGTRINRVQNMQHTVA